MKNWRRRSQEPDALDPAITLDELAWRIGASETRPLTVDPALAAGPEGLDDVFIGLDPAEAADIARALARPAPPVQPAAAVSEPPAPTVVSAQDEPPEVANVPMASQVEIRPDLPNTEDAAAAASVAVPPLLAASVAAEPPPAEIPPVAAATPTPEPLPAPATRRDRAARDVAPRDVALAALRKPGAPPDGGPGTERVKAGRTRRAGIWRDTSAVLIGVVGIVLIAQLALGGAGDNTALATLPPASSLAPTDVAVVVTVPPPTLGPTLGPVIDPSLIPGIEATPSPSPATTPAPTPGPTPRITPRPTVKPTTKPIPTPTPAPPVAKIASPISTACYLAGTVVSFNAAGSTGATSYTWNFDDGGTGPSSSQTATHIYGSAGSYGVILTVSGPGDTSFAFVTANVQASCP